MVDKEIYKLHTYALEGGISEHIVLREGTRCTINVPPSFFGPRLDNESRNAWMRRTSRSLYLDLNGISRVQNAIVTVPSKVTITMDEANNWGNITLRVEAAFQAHLDRMAGGDYGS